MVALAFVQGFGAPAFVGAITADAFGATLPFLGVLVVARFLTRRFPARTILVQRVHVAMQGLLACMAFGWWWVEPHTILTSLTTSSLGAMGWQALAGALAGLALALVSERCASPVVLREVGLATGVLFLIGGGRLYRAFDHVEAGQRLTAAAAIAAGFAVVAVAAYLLLRNRERTATAIPALAPAAACCALLLAWAGAGPAALSTRDSILVVVVDTLRADIADGGMAGVDGAAPAPGAASPANAVAMPQLARIAESGVRFTQAVSPAPWTLPATVSMLSGWNPHRHRHGESVSAWEVTTGDPAALYLPGALRDAGYLTSAFVNNPWLRPYFGFGEGFYTMRPYHGRALDGVALAHGWMGDHAADTTFTMLHLMDPHWPWDAPPGFGPAPGPCATCDSLLFAQYGKPSPQDQLEMKRRYAAEVAFTDAMLGRLYDTLLASGDLDRTWLIITSDHGEEFWEHGGFLHGHTLFDELLRVPMVVVPPRGDPTARRGARVDTQVRLEDVAATVLEIAGLDPSLAIDGKSLLALMAGTAENTTRPSIGGFVKARDNLDFSVRIPPWKAISSTEFLRNRMFRLDKDSVEQKNLFFRTDGAPLQRLFLSKQFRTLVEEPGRLGVDVARSESSGGVDASPDADTARALRSLGYTD